MEEVLPQHLESGSSFFANIFKENCIRTTSWLALQGSQGLMTDLLATQWVGTDHKGMAVFSPLQEKVYLIPMLCSYLEEGRGCKQVQSIRDIPASSLSSYAVVYELLGEHDSPNPLSIRWSHFPT